MKLGGATMGLVALAVTVLLWLIAADFQLPARVVIPIVLFLILCVLVLFQSSLMAFEQARHDLPALRFVHNTPTALILLLDPSDLFSYDTLASVYHTGEFEQFVGIGHVTNIQQDGKIQVTLIAPATGQETVLDRLRANDVRVLEKILVKPVVPRTYIELLRTGGSR